MTRICSVFDGDDVGLSTTTSVDAVVVVDVTVASDGGAATSLAAADRMDDNDADCAGGATISADDLAAGCVDGAGNNATLDLDFVTVSFDSAVGGDVEMLAFSLLLSVLAPSRMRRSARMGEYGIWLHDEVWWILNSLRFQTVQYENQR